MTYSNLSPADLCELTRLGVNQSFWRVFKNRCPSLLSPAPTERTNPKFWFLQKSASTFVQDKEFIESYGERVIGIHSLGGLRKENELFFSRQLVGKYDLLPQIVVWRILKNNCDSLISPQPTADSALGHSKWNQHAPTFMRDFTFYLKYVAEAC